MLTSQKSGNAELILDEAGPVEVIVDGSSWMHREEGSTCPPWTPTHRILKDIAYGRVLMSGLGIGYNMRLVNEQCEHIDVVEINEHVITLTSPYVDHAKVSIHHMDIDKYLPKCLGVYNVVYLDHREHFTKQERGAYRKLCEPLLSEGGRVLFWEPTGGWESNGND